MAQTDAPWKRGEASSAAGEKCVPDARAGPSLWEGALGVGSRAGWAGSRLHRPQWGASCALPGGHGVPLPIPAAPRQLEGWALVTSWAWLIQTPELPALCPRTRVYSPGVVATRSPRHSGSLHGAFGGPRLLCASHLSALKRGRAPSPGPRPQLHSRGASSFRAWDPRSPLTHSGSGACLGLATRVWTGRRGLDAPRRPRRGRQYAQASSAHHWSSPWRGYTLRFRGNARRPGSSGRAIRDHAGPSSPACLLIGRPLFPPRT